MDLAGLRNLGTIADRRVVNKQVKNRPLIEEFARRHGLLWHKTGGDGSREAWRSWLVEGYKLWRTMALYTGLRTAVTSESTDRTEPLRAFMRAERDLGNAFGSMPENDEELLEHVSILIAEQISKGLEGCTPTLLAASSLERGKGKKEGPAADFRSSINPSNLVAVAYNELVALIESKAWFKECVGCGELFRMKPGFRKTRDYCEERCYDTTRKREKRAIKRSLT
jgi:hypothetical protein